MAALQQMGNDGCPCLPLVSCHACRLQSARSFQLAACLPAPPIQSCYIPPSRHHADEANFDVVLWASAFVLLSLLINAPSIGPVMRWTGLRWAGPFFILLSVSIKGRQAAEPHMGLCSAWLLHQLHQWGCRFAPASRQPFRKPVCTPPQVALSLCCNVVAHCPSLPHSHISPERIRRCKRVLSPTPEHALLPPPDV